MVVTSNDISNFEFKVLYDLSSASPKVVITNQSTGEHLDLVNYWFEITTPSGMQFHVGSAGNTDEDGIWATLTVPEEIPQTLGRVEFSGSPYIIKGYAKDSADTVFSLQKETVIITPTGNTKKDRWNYAAAELEVDIRCDKEKVYLADITTYSYQGVIGVVVSKQLRLIYPPDKSGSVPAPDVRSLANNGLFRIPYNGAGYMATLDSVYDYTFANNTVVRIKYKFQKPFTVQCNVDLCPLLCEIERLEKEYETNGCSTEERTNLVLINSKMNRVLMAKMQPLCDFDIISLIEEIKVLGNFKCNCFVESGLNSGNYWDTELESLNTLLEEINPQCYGTVQQWKEWDLKEKIARIISVSCAGGNGGGATNVIELPAGQNYFNAVAGTRIWYLMIEDTEGSNYSVNVSRVEGEADVNEGWQVVNGNAASLIDINFREDGTLYFSNIPETAVIKLATI